ncbi:sensor histidine kinase [Paenibacillus sp. NPDC058174]|uniref:sensor histidine kinase n=1 Tax=Paenibacillus sp. NPDC058174 TaxID=3346366 RepID=UPI0036DBFD61
MTTLRIRKFTLLSLLFILTVPWVFFIAAHYLQTGTFSLGSNRLHNETLQKEFNRMIGFIETNPSNWHSVAWQSQLQAQLENMNRDALILDASGGVIYNSDPERKRTLSRKEQFSIIENGQLLGRIVIYEPNTSIISMIAIITGLLLGFFIVGVEMRRFILKPLGRMSSAVRQVAAGDWEAPLPLSRITEITEVRDAFKVMMEGLKEADQKQRKLEEERRFVIAAVAHDLRTPLFTLRGYLDGIAQGVAQTPDKLAKYVAVCREKSAQLDRLVEDLFTFTKVEYLEELNRSTVDLNRILQKEIDSLHPLAEKKQISVMFNHTAEDMRMSGDPHLLERAINNLLDNAVRHTPANGQIFVQCSKEDQHVTFTVQDTGPGFSAEELGRVFDPLYRGEVSRNRSTGGAGLGLAISQRIIRQHGGELTARNHPDGGALLEGWIPLS